MIDDKPSKGKDIAKSIRISERMNENIREHIHSMPQIHSYSEFFRYAADYVMLEADPIMLVELNDTNWQLNRMAGVVVRFEASREHVDPAYTSSLSQKLSVLLKRTKRLIDQIESSRSNEVT